MTDEEYMQKMRARQSDELLAQLAHESGLGLEAPQTRQHYATPMTSTLDQPTEAQPSQPMPELDSLLRPGNNIVGNPIPRPDPNLPQLSEGQQMGRDIGDAWQSLPKNMRFVIGQQGGMGSFASQMMQNRQMQAYRLAQVEEQRRQHDIGLLEKAMTNPRAQVMLQQLGDTQGYSMAPQAKMLSKAMKEQDYASFAAYKEVIPTEIQQQFIKGELPYHELTAWIDHARDAVKVNAKEAAKSRLVEMAMSKPAEHRTPYETQLVEEKQAALQLKKDDHELKKAQTKKLLSDAALADRGGRMTPDRTNLNKVHEAIAGVPWEQGTDDTRNAALERYAQLPQQGRQDVIGETPVGRQGRAQEYRNPITGKAAPSWAKPSTLEKLGFVNLEPSQIGTVGQLQNSNELLNEILKSGTTLLRKSGGRSWWEVPKGMAQKPLVELFKQYSGDPEVQVLESAINCITPTLSRLGGDVANVAVAERDMYAKSIFSPTDTVQSFAAKIKSIQNANKRTRQAMGFVDSEQDYIRSLVLRGLSDKEIEAAVSELRRH